jgi:hypothetical protein
VLATRLADLPFDRDIVVVCGSGMRSHNAASFLGGEGFTRVYDMQGGMAAWTFEREECDVEPLLLAAKSSGGVTLNWTPIPGSQDYQLVRGLLDNAFHAGTHSELGDTECLVDDSSSSYLTDAGPAPGDRVFYRVRQILGSWGQASDGRDVIPSSTDCD